MEHWTEYSRFLTALLVIMNPFAAVPIFLSLAREYTQDERNKIAFTAPVTVLSVLIVVAFSGEAILTGMGTSLASFRVGGGIVLLLMALAMLTGQPGTVRTTEAELHSSRILADGASIEPLLEINTAILRGLRQMRAT